MFRLRCVRDELLTGAMIFSAVFLLNEPYTCAHHRLGRILYGVMVGAFTMGFRYFGVYETGVCFAHAGGQQHLRLARPHRSPPP